MRRLSAMALLASMCLLVRADHKEGGETTTTTLKGEVVDLWGYLAKGRKGGGENAKESEAAVRGGSPAGLLTDDGVVYLIVIQKQENREPMKYVAHKVEITGTLHERSHMKGIQADAVKDLGPAD